MLIGILGVIGAILYAFRNSQFYAASQSNHNPGVSQSQTSPQFV